MTESERMIDEWLDVLAEKYEVDLFLKWGKARRTSGRHQYYREDDIHVLTFSRVVLGWYEEGLKFTEFWSIAGVWNDFPPLKGKWAVWALTLHEFAHVLQTRRGGRPHGQAHNWCFVRCLQELQEVLPFDG